MVYALSRFARNAHDHVLMTTLLKRSGVTLHSATERFDDSSTGKFVENVMAAVAQLDNDVRAERTIAGMKAALAEGRWVFVPPLGYQRTIDSLGRVSIAPDPQRGPLIRRAFELVGSGLHTKREALRLVTNLGLRTLRARPVSPQTFQQMLRNPIYCGWLGVKSWGDLEPQRADFEPIVSDDLLQRVHRVLEGKSLSVTPHDRNNPDFPLRVFARCGECGTAMTRSWSKGRTSRYAYYRCRSSACRASNIPKAEFEAGFLRYLEAMVPKPEYLRLFREIVLDVWNQRQTEAQGARRRLQRSLDSLLSKKDRIVEAFVHRGVLDQRTYDRQTAKIDEEIALAESALHDARLDELDVEGVLNFAEYVLGNSARLWTEASIEQKQRLQKLLFPSGVTDSRERGFGTAEISVIFRLLQALPVQKSRVASPTGFEPVLPT